MDNVGVKVSFPRGSAAIAWMTVAGVLVVGLIDWLQGQPPDGVIDLGNAAGLVVFCLCAIGVAVGALLIAQRDLDEPALGAWGSVLVAATIAALIADPTYAVLLFAVPLVHIARRWKDPLRRRAIVAIFVLAVVLVSLENQSWGGNNLESAMVLFIALSMTTILGVVLGRLDTALTREADIARRDEREQLAAELHDSVGHSLLASSIQLRAAQALWDDDPPGAQRSIGLASRAVDEALVDTRIAVDTVRSKSARFSLRDALPDLVDRIATASLSVELSVDGDVESVDQLTQITLYRVAQEALTNVVRHSGASTVKMAYAMTNSNLTLTIGDDGVGFDADASAVHLGLRGLEERLQRVSGRLDVASDAAAGTMLTATVERVR